MKVRTPPLRFTRADLKRTILRTLQRTSLGKTRLWRQSKESPTSHGALVSGGERTHLFPKVKLFAGVLTTASVTDAMRVREQRSFRRSAVPSEDESLLALGALAAPCTSASSPKQKNHDQVRSPRECDKATRSLHTRRYYTGCCGCPM